MTLQQQLSQTKHASYQIGLLTTKQKNQVLLSLAKSLRRNTDAILRANTKDLKAVPANYGMTDRLTLTKQRIEHMAHSIEAVVKLPDPIGELLAKTKRNGLQIERRRVPLGVLGIIYEARPNVTTEVFSLAFKTGNAVALKGGRDAYYTNIVLVQLIQQVLKKLRLPIAAILNIDPRQRTNTAVLLKAYGLVDVLIPRGSNRLIEFVRTNAQIPVIETGAGVCHTLVERSADMSLAATVIVNAKCRRCTVCNALDCLVVEQAAQRKLWKQLAPQLAKRAVRLQADPASYALLKKLYPSELLHPAKASDFGKEFLAMTLAVKTVPTAQAGIDFIQQHTSGHSEAILTNRKALAEQFQRVIDAAAVYVNTSTAFTDGFEFGLGAEVGISTQKLHARGPMGLTALTTYKWLVQSRGAIRQP
jgi:glutamate-5-semialdehyde dehydrogenase